MLFWDDAVTRKSVAGTKLVVTSAAVLALVSGSLAATGGCDSTVTSVGAWEPITRQGDGGAAELTGPGLYLEAESGELSSDPTAADGGFAIIPDAKASAGKYILPPAGLVSDMVHGSAQARYAFNVDETDDYLIWGRIYTPDITSNRLWFQVDGGEWIRWNITVGTIWYWHAFHRDKLYDDPMHFTLTAGSHQLIIANDVPGARLDKLYITNQGDTPAGNNTTCRPPHTIDRDGTCQKSCGIQALPGRPTSCGCGGGVTTFFAYDCTSKNCCFLQ